MFVDLHNHLLPGIDDGAHDLEESLAMARMAVAGGTDTMAVTPHRAWQARRDAPADWVRSQVADLQLKLQKADIPLILLPGVELQFSLRLAEELSLGSVLPLGHGQYALIEPPFDHIPSDALNCLKAVRAAGFGVVLAHPERNSEVQRHLRFLEKCAEIGVVFQLTSGSILGRLGMRPQQTAEAILQRHADWPLVIASDMHDLYERTPDLMAAARDAAAVITGLEAAQAMVDSRPRSIAAAPAE